MSTKQVKEIPYQDNRQPIAHIECQERKYEDVKDPAEQEKLEEMKRRMTQVLPHTTIERPSYYHHGQIDVHQFLQLFFTDKEKYSAAEGFHIGNIIKYVCRYKEKNGSDDLVKAEENLKELMNITKRKEGKGVQKKETLV